MRHAKKVAFIGLGTMGLPIATHIHRSQAALVGFDPGETARATAKAEGIPLADSVAECVEGAEIIITMLPTVAIAREVVWDVVGHARPGALLIELGTIGRQAALTHATHAASQGLGYIDAPVINGGAQGAKNGTLRVLAGCDETMLDVARGCLETFSTDVIHVGGVGAGQAIKMVHNTLLAVITAATAEAFSLAESFGLDPARVAEVFEVSSVRSFALEWLFPPALAGDFSGGARVDILRKDLHLTMDEANMSYAEPPFGALATKLFDWCNDLGYGDLDISVVLKALREHGPRPRALASRG